MLKVNFLQKVLLRKNKGKYVLLTFLLLGNIWMCREHIWNKIYPNKLFNFYFRRFYTKNSTESGLLTTAYSMNK